MSPIYFGYGGANASNISSIKYGTVNIAKVYFGEELIHGTSDPSSSLLLYPFDSDANDASSTGNNLTLTGATVQTTTKKYGAGSLQAGNLLGNQRAAGTMPALGTGNFTVEFWLRIGSSANGDYIVDRGKGNSFYFDNPGWVFFTNSGKFQWTIKDSYDSEEEGYEASVNLASTTTVSSSVGSFIHVALVRQGTTYRLYVDGAQEASATGSATNFVAHNFAIGATIAGSNGMASNSFVDDFRLSSTAVYPDGTTFTPPASAHSN